jgi:hypothetical protein
MAKIPSFPMPKTVAASGRAICDIFTTPQRVTLAANSAIRKFRKPSG